MNDNNFKECVFKVFNFVKKKFEFLKIRKIFFFFVLKCKQKEHVHNLNRRWAQSALKALKSSIYILCLSGCLFVGLYPINAKMDEPIGPNFFVRPRVTPGKVYELSNFQKFTPNEIRFLKNVKLFFLIPSHLNSFKYI